MTLVTEVLDRAARQCSVEAQSSWLSATDDEAVELRDDFLMETVEDILDRVDLPSPIGAKYDIVGDGSEEYAMPSQFHRLQRGKFAVYDSFLDRPCVPVSEKGNYTYLKDLGLAGGVIRYYRTNGYAGNWSLLFEDPPATGVTINVHYNSTYWKANSSGTFGASFTDPEDVVLLPRRLLEAGIVWRFRERKGLEFMPKMMEYEAQIARLANDTQGRRTINMGEPETKIRWQDQIPSFIPSS